MKNKSFFDDNLINFPNDKFAYFLGLIWSDGYVHPTRNVITLQGNKDDILEYLNILDNIKLNYRINNCFDKRTSRKYVSGVLDISNAKLSKFLKKMDFLKKSKSQPDKILEYLPLELYKYFLRGVFDGDGTFYKNKKYSNYHIYLYGPYDQNYDFLIKILKKQNIIGKVSRYEKNNGKFSYFRIIGKNNFEKMKIYLYEGYTEDKIGLKRKYEKIIE